MDVCMWIHMGVSFQVFQQRMGPWLQALQVVNMRSTLKLLQLLFWYHHGPWTPCVTTSTVNSMFIEPLASEPETPSLLVLIIHESLRVVRQSLTGKTRGPCHPPRSWQKCWVKGKTLRETERYFSPVSKEATLMKMWADLKCHGAFRKLYLS